MNIKDIYYKKSKDLESEKPETLARYVKSLEAYRYALHFFAGYVRQDKCVQRLQSKKNVTLGDVQEAQRDLAVEMITVRNMSKDQSLPEEIRDIFTKILDYSCGG